MNSWHCLGISCPPSNADLWSLASLPTADSARVGRPLRAVCRPERTGGVRSDLFRASVIEHDEGPLLDQGTHHEAGHDVPLVGLMGAGIVPVGDRQRYRGDPQGEPGFVKQAPERHVPQTAAFAPHADLGAAPRVNDEAAGPLLFDGEGDTGHADSIKRRPEPNQKSVLLGQNWGKTEAVSVRWCPGGGWQAPGNTRPGADWPAPFEGSNPSLTAK